MEKRVTKVSYAIMAICLVLAGLIGCFSLAPASCAADSEIPPYPVKDVTLIIPYSAGGATDQVARLFARHLAEVLNINVVCMNRPGASGEIGTFELADSKPDGSVLAILSAPDFIVSDIINDQFNFDCETSVEYVAKMTHQPLAYFAVKDGEFDTWEKFEAYSKAHPGEVIVGEGGIAQRVLAAAMMEHFGIQYTTVNFAGAGDVLVSLLGNHVNAASGGAQRIVDYVPGGAVPILWPYATKPEGFPDCALFSDYGMDTDFIDGTTTVSTPKGVPDEVVKSLEAACAVIFEDPEFIERLTKDLGFGYAPLIGCDAVRDNILAKREVIRVICEKYSALILSNG